MLLITLVILLLVLLCLFHFIGVIPAAMGNTLPTGFSDLIQNALVTSCTNLIETALVVGFTYLMEKALATGFKNLIASGSCIISSFIAGEIKYIWNLRANLDAFDHALDGVIELSEELMKKVNKAEENPIMQRTNAVKLWFEDIERLGSEVANQLKDRVQEVDKLCLLGFYSKDFKSSYLFAQNVENLLRQVTDLKRQGEAFEDVAEAVIADPVCEEPFDTRIIAGQESMLDKVWRFLGLEECGRIGLYGLPGVGKTTLLKQINSRFCQDPFRFQVIIKLVVSSKPNFDNIQQEIGKALGLSTDRSWKDKFHEDKAKDISDTLCQKKFVLLLDDIWDRIELEELGVPLQCLKSGSKIIFTTRKSDVCSKMGADEKVEVKCLSFDEALELFQQKVGKAIIDSDPQIRKLANEVVKECDCLPLALITVGGVMAGKDTPSEWKRAIKVLRSSAAGFEDSDRKVFSHLKFSYDSLSDDTTRSCLLYCRLYPEDYVISIRDLIDCWIGEGLLGEYSEGYVIIGNLVQACLLEKEGEDKVKMHDVIRDMALWIACGSERERENCLVEAGFGLNEAPEVGKWEGIKRMSLMNNQIRSLPTVGTHLDLQTLFLNDNFFFRISSDFFQYLPFLKVLDLSKAKDLLEVPLGISKLVSLQHLDLSYTRISKLPKELRALVNLKCLKLENATKLCTVPRKLISEFKHLQVFRLTNCCVFGGASEGSVLSGGFLPLIEELCGLKCLKALSIELKSFKAFQRFSRSQSLKSCTQTLYLKNFTDLTPPDVSFLKNMKNLRELYLCNCEFEDLNIDCANLVSIEAQSFHSLRTVRIINCKNLRDLTWLVLAPNLKTIEIEGCSFLEEIISNDKLSEVQKKMGILNPLAKLQRLVLRRLPILKIICQNSLPFPHLEHLIVRNCPNLTELPLNSISAKDLQMIIQGEEDWWKELQWKEEATKNAFLPCFRSWGRLRNQQFEDWWATKMMKIKECVINDL